jgi:hypothetical protein
MKRVYLQLLLATIFVLTLEARAQETLVPNGATWRWRKGTNEVSNPIADWRTNGFEDATWLTGPVPL